VRLLHFATALLKVLRWLDAASLTLMCMTGPILTLEMKPQDQAVVEIRLLRDEAVQLRDLLEDAGIETELLGFELAREVVRGGMAGVTGSIFESVCAVVGTAGGLGGISAVLKVFIDRNKYKRVRFGQGGELIEAQGLSAGEIQTLLDSLHARRTKAVSDNGLAEGLSAGELDHP
jgi:hypothetical protein